MAVLKKMKKNEVLNKKNYTINKRQTKEDEDGRGRDVVV
jgi:hypothetical protein